MIMKKRVSQTSAPEKAAPKKSKYDDILNDGWADDVELHYPEGSWRPPSPADDLEIMDFENTSPLPVIPEDEEDDDEYEDLPVTVKKVSATKTSPKAAKGNASDASAKDKKKKKRKKGSRAFRIFLCLWLGGLAITLAILLRQFYTFLEKIPGIN